LGSGITYNLINSSSVTVGTTTGSSFTSVSPGTYSLTATNSCGTSTALTGLVVNAAPSAPAVSITPSGSVTLCPGNRQLYTASGSGNYQWLKDGSPINGAISSTYSASLAGTYSVRNTTTAGCITTSNTSVVTMASNPNGSIASSSTIICPNSFVSLSANGGNSYQWYLNGSPINGEVTSSLKATTAGQYSLDIISIENCKVKASNTILLENVIKPKPNFDFLSSCQNQPISFNNKTDVTGSGNINWYWNFSDNAVSNLLSPTHIFTDAKNYTVTLIAQSANCPAVADSIKKSVVIKASIPGIRYYTVRTMKGKPFQLEARNIGIDYLWQSSTDLSNPKSRTPVITPSQEREYKIQIASADGCITTDTLLVQVLSKTEVFVPKAFTPNINGVNDLLRPILVNIPFIKYFQVYNRWGQLLFETKTLGLGWNGLYKGTAQPVETYTWIFEGIDSEGNVIKSSGKSVLIR
jgi:gliding motility-associated-like protein